MYGSPLIAPSDINRSKTAILNPSSRTGLLMLFVSLSILAVALFAPVQSASAQGNAGSCASGGAVPNASQNSGLVADCEALLHARETLAGTASLNWSANTPIGEWDGVRLGGSPPRITELILEFRDLSGEIPAELGELSGLGVLSLTGNQLTGPLPAELGKLANLESLKLSQNQLTGRIPQNLGDLANLLALFLSGNQLSGAIPAELGSLGNLIFLYLDGNRLTGRIPPDLGNLSNLSQLHMSRNQLTGLIPAELGNLSNLEELWLEENRLSGPIPPTFRDLKDLELLVLSGNQLTGPVPTWFGGLSRLENVHLQGNRLTGTIPADFGNFDYLAAIYLDTNQLTGEIPTELGDLGNLGGLSLSGNQLTGCIPAGLVPGQIVDIDALGLPFCEVSLGGLTVEPGSLTPTFDPRHTTYSVEFTPVQISVIPATDQDFIFVRTDESDIPIDDADPDKDGHQVDFDEDISFVWVEVHSADGRATKTYLIAARETGTCSNGIAVAGAASKPWLVSDCTALLAARDELAGTAELNWSAYTSIYEWEGVFWMV